MKKYIQAELGFHGDGTIKSVGDTTFVGGVVQPDIDGLKFTIHRQVLDEDDILNPVDGEQSVEGTFQINLIGNSLDFKKLGCYFLALSELDVSADPDGYHDHFDDLLSADKRTHIHLIARKNEN